MRFRGWINISLLLIASLANGQDKWSDSLMTELDRAETDSAKASIYYTLGLNAVYEEPEKTLQFAEGMRDHYDAGSPFDRGRYFKLHAYYHDEYSNSLDSAVYFYKQAIDEFTQLNDNSEIGYLHEYIGNAYFKRFDFKRAFENFKIGYDYYIKAEELEYAADLLNSLAVTTSKLGDVDQSFEYHQKAIDLYEEIDDTLGLAMTYLNMGVKMYEVRDYNRSLELLHQSLNFREHLNDLAQIAIAFDNIGIVHKDLYNLDSARWYADSAAKINMQVGDLIGYLNNKDLLGGIEFRAGNKDEAVKHWEESLELRLQFRVEKNLFTSYINLGAVYSTMPGKINKAEEYLQKAKEIAEETENLDYTANVYEALSELYSQKGDFKKAFYHHVKYKHYDDSLLSIAKQQDMIRRETAFWLNQEKRRDSLVQVAEKEQLELKHEKERLEADAELREQRTYIWGGIALALVFVVVSVVLFRSYRIKKRANILISAQKQEVETQKEMVEEKNKEIMDSIEYAKRLQEAILPPRKLVAQYLPQSFILYKPKDIVAGDFYYMEPVDGALFYAAADCTGHGVPGAMVSVVCSNAMNKAIIEEGLRDPGKILDRVRELVIERFERSEEKVNDGMDISLVKLSGKEVEFAGANNPLWIVRKDTDEVEEIRGDRQPVGRFAIDESFTTHKVKVSEGDSLYVFSDGYVDQFGGERGKKFKSKNFKKALLDVKDLPMEEQRVSLNNTFESWRGEIEQIDDVCVIGLRL